MSYYCRTEVTETERDDTRPVINSLTLQQKKGLLPLQFLLLTWPPVIGVWPKRRTNDTSAVVVEKRWETDHRSGRPFSRCGNACSNGQQVG